MENNPNPLQNPAFWWVFNLILTVFLGIFANLLTDRVKVFWGRFSVRQRERNEKENHQIEVWARKCVASQQRFAYVQAKLTWNGNYQQLLVTAIQTYLIMSIAAFILVGIGMQAQIHDALRKPLTDYFVLLLAGTLLPLQLSAPTLGDLLAGGAILIQWVMLFMLYSYYRSLQKSMFWAKVVTLYGKLLDEQDTVAAQQKQLAQGVSSDNHIDSAVEKTLNASPTLDVK